MAVTATVVAGSNIALSNKRRKVFDLAFSGNYATGGEALTAATLGFRTIEELNPHGPARSTDLATANPVSYDYTNSKVVFYESGASGAAIAEKTNAEAYPTGANVRVTVIGTGAA